MNLKIFFAIITDTYRPFGLRRKPWMLFGWGGVLLLLLFLAFYADKLDASSWLATLLSVQVFLMFSDVPADGYSVELGQLEPKEQRGQILATGQRVRFTFCVLAGVIQTFFLNGPSTNNSDCAIGLNDCWEFGLKINEYYGLLFCLVCVLYIPIWFLKEPDASLYPLHSLTGLFYEIWLTVQNLTTFYLIIFVLGINMLTNFTSQVNIVMQYYLINLTNFQVG